MSDVRFSCPYCEQHIAVDDTYGGEQVGCPNCEADIRVPPMRSPPIPSTRADHGKQDAVATSRCSALELPGELKLLVRIPQGAEYDYTLAELRRELQQGKISRDCTARLSDPLQQWHPVGAFVGLEPLPADLTYRLPRKAPLFLVIYGWIYVILHSFNFIVSLIAVGTAGPLPLFGCVLGIFAGVGLIRGSGRTVLLLIALFGFALIFLFAAWPAKSEEVIRISGIPFHVFLLMSIFVFGFPPIAYGVIKRKELM